MFTLGGGSTVGILAGPGEWYATLQKPAFQPPDWLFAPVWLVLYTLIGIAGWSVWRRKLRPAQELWWLQIALNLVWPPVFFALQLPGPALSIIVVLLGVILAFVAATWREDRLAAALFLPYAAWVAYATLLNAAIWWLN